jgi:hypothetical protein
MDGILAKMRKEKSHFSGNLIKLKNSGRQIPLSLIYCHFTTVPGTTLGTLYLELCSLQYFNEKIIPFFKHSENRNAFKKKKKKKLHWRQWLTPVILVTQEAEIRKTVIRSQPGQTVHKTLSRKYLSQPGAGDSHQ